MDISQKEVEGLRDFHKRIISQSLSLSTSLLLLCFVLTACTSIRPVIKIGLLAPFEGLQRRTGYMALTAMRQAIADSGPATVAIMPLALDSGANPSQAERAVHKLLQDNALRVVIGPYHLLLAPGIQSIIAPTGLPWFFPFAVNPSTGFVPPDRVREWVQPLLAAAAQQAAALGCRRLVVAGWTGAELPLTALQLQSAFALPMLVDEPVTAVSDQDALVWLGDAEAGALYFAQVRAHAPAAPFFLGPQADDPIFSEHSAIRGPVYLLYWRDDEYEQWRLKYREQSPAAYLTYRATQAAIVRSLGQPWPSSQSWRVQTIAVNRDKVR